MLVPDDDDRRVFSVSKAHTVQKTYARRGLFLIRTGISIYRSIQS